MKKIDNRVTRIEVIDENGRSYVHMRVKEAEMHYQDDNRTLKIFIRQINH